MFCQKCGSKLLEDSMFCQKCGTKTVSTEAIVQTPEKQMPVTPQQVQPQSYIEPMQSFPHVNRTAQSSKTPKKSVLPILLTIVIIAAVVAGYFLLNRDNDINDDPSPVVEKTPEPTVEPEQTPLPIEDDDVEEGQSVEQQIVMYDIPSHPIASYVPDFLAFITNSAEHTNENNTVIDSWDEEQVFFEYEDLGNDWNLQSYIDFLLEFGFAQQESPEGIISLLKDDISVSIDYTFRGAIPINISRESQEQSTHLIPDNWKTITGSRFAMDIPESWRYAYIPSMDSHEMLLLPNRSSWIQVIEGEFILGYENFDWSMYTIHFNDGTTGNTGWQISESAETSVWEHTDLSVYIILTIFDEDEEYFTETLWGEIESSVKSLRAS